jgi:hypothetical protein
MNLGWLSVAIAITLASLSISLTISIQLERIAKALEKRDKEQP